MPAQLSNFASSVVNERWLITGGVDVNFFIQDGIYLYEEGIFAFNGYMPTITRDHCQVTLNDTHVFVTSGYSEEMTFILNGLQQTSIVCILEDIPELMYGDAWGLLNNPVNGQGECTLTCVSLLMSFTLEILVTLSDQAFLFSLTTLEWREGPKLPKDLKFVNYSCWTVALWSSEAWKMMRILNWRSIPPLQWMTNTTGSPKYATMAVNVPNGLFTC